MNITIKLPDDQAEALKAQAAAQGLSVEDWLQKLAVEHAPPSPSALNHREIVKELCALRRRIKPDTVSVRQMVEEGRRF